MDASVIIDELRGYGRDVAQGASNAVASNVSAPVDLLAWLLRKGGVPMPSNPVGGSDWMAQKGLTREPQNRNAGLVGEFAGLTGPMVAAAKAPQLARGLLQMGENAMVPQTLNKQAGMIKTPLGQIPETASDVKKLSARFGRLLDDAGVQYSYDKSNLSPARYFTFDKPASPLHTAQDIEKYGAEAYKVRISDHKNVHGADYSVDPHTGATFEEMLQSVKNLGVPISDKVLPKNTIPDQVRKLQNQLLNGEYIKIAAKSLPAGASRAEIFAAAKPLEAELYTIANLEKSQLNREHLNRLKQLLRDKP